jgi:hypothetical protein
MEVVGIGEDRRSVEKGTTPLSTGVIVRTPDTPMRGYWLVSSEK